MDLGAQRCVERRLFHAHARSLRELCAEAFTRSLCHDVELVCLRFDGETHGRDLALRSPPSGLLAVETNCRSSQCPARNCRKGPALSYLRGVMRGHSSRADPRAQFARELAAILADQQRIRFDLHLPPADVLAGKTRRLLSAST